VLALNSNVISLQKEEVARGTEELPLGRRPARVN
jgi:hypothetical protein